VSLDPVNFWALNSNSSKMAEDIGMHAPRKSPDMTLRKNLEKGVWPGSLGVDMHSNERLLVVNVNMINLISFS